MRRSRNSLLVVCFAVLFCFLAGSANPVPANAKEVKLGILCALSGPAAPWGIPNSRGIMLGCEEVNDNGGFTVGDKNYTFTTIRYDHKYVPAESVKAANKAIYSDKCDFLSIMGGSCAVATVPIMKSNNILSLNFAGGGKELTNPGNPLVFRYNPCIEGMYLAVLPVLKEREGIKTMAVINPDDATGHSGLEAAELGAEHSGLEIVTEEFFERGTKELTALLTRVKAKNPDLIDTSYTDPATSALICKQAREVGFKGTILLAWGPDPDQVLQIAGANADKVYMSVGGPVSPQTPYQKEVYKRYIEKYNEDEWDPNVWVQYGLGKALAKAIEEAQSLEPQKIADKLESITWETPTGELTFGGKKLFGIKRQLLTPATLYQYQGKDLVFISAPEVPAGILD